MDEEIITEAITDVREALQYEFLEPVTVEQIFPENSPES